MKILKNTSEFFNKKKTLLLVVFGLLLAYVTYNSFSGDYHKKEIKILDTQLEELEGKAEKAIIESKVYRDSSYYYETIAEKLDKVIEDQNSQITNLQAQKNAALRKVKDVDAFLKERYIDVKKAKSNIVVDKNDGKAIVDELIQKDFLVQEVQLLNISRDTLNSKISLLEYSLDFSKDEALKLNSALNIRNQEYILQEDLTKTLKLDLKTAKKKSFWNTVKGIGIGIGAGVVIGTQL